jgi:hypothetical protein
VFAPSGPLVKSRCSSAFGSKPVELIDASKFTTVFSDRDLIRRIWRRLKEMGADPTWRDMLALKDLKVAINALVEKASTYDRLEEILNDTSASDRRVIERVSDAFYG